jgi:hypothetical protein
MDQPMKKAATPSSWKPGQSGNPKGRPRSGLAFAERVRERIDPDLVIELALQVAADDELSPLVRLNALLPLVDRGFQKPATAITATVTPSEPAFDVSSLPVEKQRALLDLIRQTRALTTEGDG